MVVVALPADQLTFICLLGSRDIRGEAPRASLGLTRLMLTPPNPRFRSMWTSSVIENTHIIHEYMKNSMERDSDQMRRIQAAVKRAGMFVVLGFSERDGGSLYMGQSFISPDGEIKHHRRKIKPTHIERTIWGEGQVCVTFYTEKH